MNSGIRELDTVALLEDIPTAHAVTGAPLMLRRGQMGTVVLEYDGTAFEIEFSDRQGRSYAMLPVPASKLMVLRDTAEALAPS